MGSALLIAPSVTAAAAAIVLIYALRGRRVNDHPICRKCGFDLLGKPVDSTRCSECGANLSRRRAVRIGLRERRRALLGASAPILLLCLGSVAVVGWVTARGMQWQSYKPFWMLTREADGHVPASRDAALRELLARMQAGKLSAQQVNRLADLALVHQANGSEPWLRAWGAVVERAHSTGQLPHEKWQRYALQAVGLELRARLRVGASDPLPLSIEQSSNRVDQGGVLLVEYSIGPEYRIGGHAVRDPRGPEPFFDSVYPDNGGVTDWDDALTDEVRSALTPGSQTIRVPVRVIVFESSGEEKPRIPLAEKQIVMEAVWTLLAPGEPSLQENSDPLLRPAVEKEIRIDLRNCYATELSGPPPKCRLGVAFNVDRAPVGLAYEVFVRANSREARIGSLVLGAGHIASHRPAGDDIPDWPKPNQVDVVLKPSRSLALRSVDLTEYWTGEVVIKNVPVSPSRP